MRSEINFLPLVLMVLLAGCGSMGGVKEPAPVIEREPSAPTTEPATKPEATKPAPSATESSKKGGYYLDDGPGDNAPADLDAIPDAVVKKEPIRAASSRPYEALGETYTPMTEYQPYKAQGIASWYGRRYHGQKTSSGEIYDMYSMTAAHTILPIPSYVRVTNPESGRSVVVRVNDRGPFKKDRLIDLSYAAAHRLRIVKRGSGLVDVELINPDQPTGAAATPASAVSTTPAPATPEPQTPPAVGGFFVQVGAFRQPENANQLRDKVQGLAQGSKVDSVLIGDLYRVRLGPYKSAEEAGRAAANIKNS